MIVGSGRLSLTKPEEKSLGMPELRQSVIQHRNTTFGMNAAISFAYIQLTRKRANSNIFPPNRTSVITQLGNVFVDRIIETEVASRMLI
jgi:hypothetical protein